MYLKELSTSPLMHISTVKTTWRVLALCIVILIGHSAYDISCIDKSFLYDSELFICGVNFYSLRDINSCFILSLLALLAYGLIKLNKTGDGWKQMKAEIYLSILIGIMHLMLGSFQYDLNIDWFC